jgi:polysaccharide export outer membrane protein
MTGWFHRVAAAVAVAAALAAAGCLGSGGASAPGPLSEPFRPDERRGGAWYESLHGAAEPAAEPASALPSDPAVTPGKEDGPTEFPTRQALRRFERGDRVVYALLGIPDEVKNEDKVDERGMVTLPHIGEVRFEGKTTSEVERDIERIYVERKIFTYVNATVVAPDDEFFVRGEVRREGGFPLMGAMTLQKAVAVAGGYTEFADRKRANIRRGEQILQFNMREIETGRQEDPLLMRGDIIYVPRRGY